MIIFLIIIIYYNKYILYYVKAGLETSLVVKKQLYNFVKLVFFCNLFVNLKL